MANPNYQIFYTIVPQLSFSSNTAIERHLKAEEKIWQPFLDTAAENQNLRIQTHGGQVSMETLSKAFEVMLQSVGEERRFNQLTKHPTSTLCLPPPSDTLEGQLILGLFENSRKHDAIAAYVWFVAHNMHGAQKRHPSTQNLFERGYTLWTAAIASSALPFNKVSSQKIAGAARQAVGHVEALNAEVSNANKINSDHESALSDIRTNITDTGRRVIEIVAKRERMRRQRHSEWVKEKDAEMAEVLLNVEKRIDKIDHLNALKQQERESEFERLQELFETQLRLRAPVKLWEGRETAHKSAARAAFIRFFLSALAALAIGVLVPYCAGDYIAESFFTNLCNNAEPPECERVFSAKGPLTITGLLLVLSLIMWITRLQYRVFLSERHLALDASEKKAFTETYLAMKEGQEVGADNEAIVLAALFRPTQDGIIKDDESGVDLSAAAILAKQLGRNT